MCLTALGPASFGGATGNPGVAVLLSGLIFLYPRNSQHFPFMVRRRLQSFHIFSFVIVHVPDAYKRQWRLHVGTRALLLNAWPPLAPSWDPDAYYYILYLATNS